MKEIYKEGSASWHREKIMDSLSYATTAAVNGVTGLDGFVAFLEREFRSYGEAPPEQQQLFNFHVSQYKQHG